MYDKKKRQNLSSSTKMSIVGMVFTHGEEKK